MKHALHIIVLEVLNLQKSISFYRDGLGFEITYLPNVNHAVFLPLGGVIIELSDASFKEESSQEKKNILDGIKLVQNVGSEKEVQGLLMLAIQAGGKILKAPGKTTWGGYSGHFADLDGYVWVINYWSGWKYTKDGMLVI